MAVINGSTGNDIIDELVDGGGLSLEDQVFADAGNDDIFMYANYGFATVVNGNIVYHNVTDTVHGGEGDDTLHYDLSFNATYVSVTATADPAGGSTGVFMLNNPGGNTVAYLNFDAVENFDLTLTSGGNLTLGDGDDRITTNAGATSTFNMGAGGDRLTLNWGGFTTSAYMNVALSGDLASGYSGTYYVSGGYAQASFSGVEHFTITSGSGSDTLTTGDGDDVLTSNGGSDFVAAGKGVDVIDGGLGTDRLSVDLSDDASGVTIDLLVEGAQQSGGAGSVTGFESFQGAVTGSSFDDVLREGLLVDYDATFNTGAGNDVVQVSRGTDAVNMGDGSDRLVLDHSYVNTMTSMTVALSGDLATGYSGTYYISGGYATNAFTGVEHFTITGAGATDRLVTGTGDDILSAAAGNDYVTAGKGNDIVDGGADTDALSIDLSDEAAGISIDLLVAGAQQSGGTGSVTGFESFHGTVTGSGFGDVLREGVFDYDSTFNTGAGDDLVQVSRGVDAVNMGDGGDRLVLDHSYIGTATYMTVALSGDLATGYSGTYYVSGGYATNAFTGVEHFTITGAAATDTLVTGDGDDIVSAAAGNDYVTAGKGNDVVDGGANTDALSIDLADEAAGVTIDLLVTGAQQSGGTGSVTGFESFHGTVTGSGFDDVLREGVFDYNATFNTGAGADLVQVSRGSDSVNMGEGNDRLVLDTSYINTATYMNVAMSGDMTTGYSGSYYVAGGYANTAFSGVENFTLTSGGAGDTLIAGDGNDVLASGAGNDVLTAGRGNDAIDGGADIDALGIDLSDELAGVTIDLLATGAQQSGGTGSVTGVESFQGVVAGSAFADVLREGVFVFDAAFSTGDGDDIVQVSRGTDSVAMGSGSDRLVLDYSYIDTGTYMNVALSGDLTTGYAGSYYVAGGYANTGFSGVEAFSISTGGAADTLTTGDGDDILSTGAGNDIINAGGGNDIITGGAGNDLYNGGDGSDTAIFAGSLVGVTVDLRIAIAQTTGEGSDTLTSIENVTGTAFADVLTGNADANMLDGGGGADILTGGLGDDTYVVDRGADNVFEAAGEGYDTVRSSVTFFAETQSIERIVLTGISNVNATGNGADNVLIGNTANNILDGKGGNDEMRGGRGSDVYYVGNFGDVVVENSGEGVDEVRTALGSYTLTAEVEILTGQSNNGQALTGNARDNGITGGTGADRINGGTGADVMTGGAGDDIYTVDNVGDNVVEGNAIGYDVINSSVSYSLAGRYVEELALTGSTHINATGNAFANMLRGNNGNNILDGKGGADVMLGGRGHDIYYVDNVGDVVTENAAEGTDEVRTTLSSYTLTAEVEALTGLSNAGQTLTGNGNNNGITGSNGADRLDGGAGNDMMTGGAGNDVYVVDSAGDVVVELAGAGTDTIESGIGFSLAGLYVENLVLGGTGNINATGNVFANALTGNAGNNILDGAGGSDLLTGGAGADRFNFTVKPTTSNMDSILDFIVADDTIGLAANVFAAGPAGVLAASRFQTGSVALDADDRILYDAATGNIFYDADGTGAVAAVRFAQVDAGLALTNADFLIL